MSLPLDLIIDAAELANREKYQKIKKIGEGTYAVVYLARIVAPSSEEQRQPSSSRSPTKNESGFVAIKKIKMIQGSSGLDFSAIREIKYLQTLAHVNIIHLLDVYTLKNAVHLVLEYSEYDLEMMVKEKKIVFMPADIKSWMWMLLKAVDFCHQHWVLHRDIKPNNLLIAKDGQLKLADFGLARDYGLAHAAMTSAVVTRWYQAPELLFGCRHYSPAIDMWSVGCIFAELMLRTPYLPGDSDVSQLNTIFRALGSPTPNEWPGMTSLPDYIECKWYPKQNLRTQFTAASDDAIDLLSKLLVYDPAKRLTSRQALLHPYFTLLPRPTPPADLPKLQPSSQNTDMDFEALAPDLPMGKRKLVPRKLFE